MWPCALCYSILKILCQLLQTAPDAVTDTAWVYTFYFGNFVYRHSQIVSGINALCLFLRQLHHSGIDLLLYCAKHQGKILTKQQIYEEVWGEEYFYDDSNIMAIISRLRKKLEVNPSSPKYIQTVKGIGYRFNKEV